MKRPRAVAILLIVIGAGIGAYYGLSWLLMPDYQIESGVTQSQDLFVSGSGGYVDYRIPALIALPNNVVVAFAEGRVDSSSDYGNIDLVMRRSTDGGQTWGSMQVLWDSGTLAIQNPTPVYDAATQNILLAVTRNRTDLHILNSSDGGATWSAPRAISNVRQGGWTTCVTGPVHAIQLQTGRLLLPAAHEQGGVWNSHVIYSDDHGETWSIGAVFTQGMDECTLVEATNGSVYLNFRQNVGAGARMYAWSADGGVTFTIPKVDPTLIEPVCQGSVIRFTNTTSYGTNRVLFSNPASSHRENMAVRLSYDECGTWPVARTIFRGPAGYSDLAVLANGTACILFERGRRFCCSEEITFVQFDLMWLTAGQDTLDPK